MQGDLLEALLDQADLTTPAFVIDVQTLREDAEATRLAAADEETQVLLALKAFSVPAALRIVGEIVDGFAASSLFELQLARRVGGHRHSLHLTTPGLRPDEIGPIGALADYLSFNSLTQWQRYRDRVPRRVSCGLRVNPQRSYVGDARYDPCRESSKLGVPLDRLKALLGHDPGSLEGLEGLHFHTNCDCSDLQPLLETVECLLGELDPLFDRLRWINFGGGYLFHAPQHLDALSRAKKRLRARGSYRLFMEPGAAMVRRAGYLVSTVVDLFPSGDRQVAVLDTSVNHMPEVFEYQFAPDVLGDSDSGEFEYLLAGSACLAGDLFGDYAFAEPLTTGSRVIFPDLGAYSLVKSNMFNGINLPTLYLLTENGELQALKRYRFEDFLSLCGE